MQYKDHKFGMPVELIGWVLPIILSLLFAFLVSVLNPTIRRMVYGKPSKPAAASADQHRDAGKRDEPRGD